MYEFLLRNTETGEEWTGFGYDYFHLMTRYPDVDWSKQKLEAKFYID